MNWFAAVFENTNSGIRRAFDEITNRRRVKTSAELEVRKMGRAVHC